MSRPSARTLRVAVASVALLGMSAAGVTQLASAALFTDQGSSGPAELVAGTVKVAVGGNASTQLAMSAMPPGQSVFGTVTVQNTGNLEQRIAVTSTDSGTDSFGTTLQLAVVESATCSAATSFAVPLYNGVAGTTAGTAVIGNKSAGQQAGDRVVAANATVSYCLRVTLPSDAANGTQGDAAALTFTAFAEQTANNA